MVDMERKLRPLGDYYQLLRRHGLLASNTPLSADLTRTVALVSCDSKEAVPNTLFICKGAHFKGEYLAQAVRQGAFAYLSETEYPEGVGAVWIPVTDVRRAMAIFADVYYDHPSAGLNVVGITGTKGKSSTSYYLKYIFDEYMKESGGAESGVIGSIETYDGTERFESHLTTPEPLELERHLANAVSAGIRYLAMEVSSQALKYDRVYNVDLAAAVFLNIGFDHVSPVEHPDFEDYFQSKLKIFDHTRLACVNLDSDRLEDILAAAGRCPQVITFSRSNPAATVFASNIRKSGNDILFRVKTPRFSREFRLTMPGLFNVENALAAIAVCEGLGIPDQHIYVGLMKARVPGRMEVYANANDRVIAIVDYAHNRLSFEKLFESVLEEYPGRRIVTVFGCPGKKAYDRRRDLGEIAGSHSQLVILTEEDSGEENTEDICREIATHVESRQCDYSIQPNRGEAIRQAVMSSETETVILITGKGAETRQKRGTAYIDCPSDVEYTKESLHEYDLRHGLDGLEKIRGLMDVLPALRRWANKTVVVKYGGSAQGSGDHVYSDLAALAMAGVRVVLVHGGGKTISSLLERLGVESRFEGGYRVTDAAVLEAAEMALSAQVNKQLVTALSAWKVAAVGISGKDGSLLTAACKAEQLGRVGEITRVDTTLLNALLDAGFLPVVSPIAAGEDGEGYNCNADDAARAIAEAMKADKLAFLTDTDGILVDSHNRSTVIPHMDLARARELLDAGLIAGGMAPKLAGCIHAVSHGVEQVVVLNGTIEHALLLDTVSAKTQGTTIVETVIEKE
ncbi:MAG: UDP-N-acetylmuramoylalanyl-D-glutamate--2,6-diaminopimelate ligase [Oscillospiraceae bacterium]|nr:UDP-N-acetylmuramoylalanyl-D-glutamate--2,6-diaminopimelate ligase [Oscillospiraceae bacterium]